MVLAACRSSMRMKRMATFSKLEQVGQWVAVGKAGFGVAELVEEGVGKDFDGLKAVLGIVYKDLGDEVDGFGRGAGTEDLGVRGSVPCAKTVL